MKSSSASLDSTLDGLTPEVRAELRRTSRAELWRRNDLADIKLHPDQRRVDDAVNERRASREVLEIARKWGKTWWLMYRANRVCLAKPKSRVVYGAPTYKHLEEFILPVIGEFFEDAPDDVRPTYSEKAGHLEYPNGSWIHFFGADDKEAANRGRGPKAELAIFDEAGFCPVLRYVLKSVFKPSLLLSGGPTLLGSTPSDEPEHDFTRYAEIAEANGTYARRTIYDNPLLTKEQIQKFIEEDAKDDGMTVEEYLKTPDFRREYLAERITDSTLAVMGDDWTSMREKLFRAVERPKFFDAYTILDMGGVDPHAVLFGYYHFPLGKIVIEDELLLRNGENTSLLADAIKAKEQALWGVSAFDGTLRGLSDLERATLPPWLKMEMAEKAPGQPYMRICDNDTQMATDLVQLHGLVFVPTRKDQKRLQVNNWRVEVRTGGVLIHPRCRNLDRHLKQTTWQNARMLDYKRTAAGEHGDLLDDCVYFARNVRKNRNPEPKHWNVDIDKQWLPDGDAHDDEERQLISAWGGQN